MYLTTLFPAVDSGKFLSDRGFVIGGGIFLVLLLLVAWLAGLRWWDCAIPLVIPLWIAGFDITNYWTGRIWLAFIVPIAASAVFAAFRYHVKRIG